MQGLQNAEGDILVAVVGLAGTGKSTFINIATQDEKKRLPAGDGLDPVTEEIQSVRAIHPDGREVVLIDTPSFGEESYDIAKMMEKWLAKYPQRNAKIAGILYLHRITDNRMATDPHMHFRMLSTLGGGKAIQNVILVTTMWSDITNEPGLARQREKELKDKWWKTMLNLGSTIVRFDKTFDSAWTAIDIAIREPLPVTTARQELKALKGELLKRKTGTQLYKKLKDLIARLEKALLELQEGADKSQHAYELQVLNARCAAIREELCKAGDEIIKLKIPLGQRLLLSLGFSSK